MKNDVKEIETEKERKRQRKEETGVGKGETKTNMNAHITAEMVKMRRYDIATATKVHIVWKIESFVAKL